MLTFKDNTIYEKSKYTIILRHLGRFDVEIEYLHPDSNWHSLLPFEDDLKQLEKNGIDISFWSKYRKWQKRKRYTEEEFYRIFDNN